ncbi:copper amine oxidase N-terminal domain-containing protein [Paenibacillus alginolyticus]|uniref:copper amine oxidase N-terminal domain-containing protein n=1 Tax=Paenibacillus alginolyticus TaxID=59839 RepID=UPI000415C101|nr:copper amine oxidase N-terminal domain-containing protein [Paenibacillus alginolyticus]MCY9666505.1 copper amine oxidase N-terminal domain-containing protein [Paenibacillus alginolyticus]
MLKEMKATGLCLIVLTNVLFSIPSLAFAAAAESDAKALNVVKELQSKEPVSVYYESTFSFTPGSENAENLVRFDKVWDDTPNGRFRSESIVNGKKIQLYIGKEGKAVSHDFVTGEVITYAEQNNDMSFVKASQAVLSRFQETDAVFIGEDIVSGRKVYHLAGKGKKESRQYTDKNGKPATINIESADMELWFDKETGLILREIDKFHGDISETMVTKLEVSLNFQNSLFNLDEAKAEDNEIKVIIDGEQQSFEQPPIIMDGSTLVPLRAIFEKFGAIVEWNDKEQSITAKKGGVAIQLKIGSKTATVNGSNKTLESPAQIQNGYTMVPIRFVSEAFGAKVKWEQELNTIVILMTP